MRQNKECDCSSSTTGFDSVRFEMNDPNIELKCIICGGLIGWWDGPTKKIVPLKRKWSEDECLAMR